MQPVASRVSSPYSRAVADFFIKLNEEFCLALGLMAPFKYDDVLPGERFGIITPRSIKPDTERAPANRNVRTGYEFQVIELEILVVLGCHPKEIRTGRLESEITGVMMMLDIPHVIPTLKENLPSELIYDLQATGETAQTLRQSVRPPHTWTVDVTSGAEAKLVIRRDAQGTHANPDWILKRE